MMKHLNKIGLFTWSQVIFILSMPIAPYLVYYFGNYSWFLCLLYYFWGRYDGEKISEDLIDYAYFRVHKLREEMRNREKDAR